MQLLVDNPKKVCVNIYQADMGDNKRTLEELRLKILASIGKDDANSGKEHIPSKVAPEDSHSGKRNAKSVQTGLPTHPSKRVRHEYSNSDRQGIVPVTNSGTIIPRHHQPERQQYYQQPNGNNHRSRRVMDSNRWDERYHVPHVQDNNNNCNSTHESSISTGYRTRVRPNMDQRYNTQDVSNNSNHNSRSNLVNRRPNKNVPQLHKDPNYVPPAFRDQFRYNNATYSRLNCTVIINNPLIDKIDTLRSLTESFLINQQQKLKGLLGHNLRNDKLNPVEEDFTTIEIESHGSHCTLTFASFQSSTLVLSCRTFFNRQLGLPSLIWSRPNSYVEFTDHITRLSNGNVIAIEEVSSPADYGRDILSADFGTEKFGVYPIHTTVTMTESGTTVEKFTNCIILTFTDGITKKIIDTLDQQNLKWFTPNKSELGLKQRTVKWLFSDMSQVIKSSAMNSKLQSNVLLLWNCVDPTDLKDDDFVMEIHDTLLATLEGAKTVKIIEPGIDYRLNLAHVSNYVGAIFVQFEDTDMAKNAMETINGAEFNGRTVLCSRFNPQDFETVGLLPFNE